MRSVVMSSAEIIALNNARMNEHAQVSVPNGKVNRIQMGTVETLSCRSPTDSASNAAASDSIGASTSKGNDREPMECEPLVLDLTGGLAPNYKLDELTFNQRMRNLCLNEDGEPICRRRLTGEARTSAIKRCSTYMETIVGAEAIVCLRCRKTFSLQVIHLAHIIARKHGEPTSDKQERLFNHVPICKRCNNGDGRKNDENFLDTLVDKEDWRESLRLTLSWSKWQYREECADEYGKIPGNRNSDELYPFFVFIFKYDEKKNPGGSKDARIERELLEHDALLHAAENSKRRTENESRKRKHCSGTLNEQEKKRARFEQELDTRRKLLAESERCVREIQQHINNTKACIQKYTASIKESTATYEFAKLRYEQRYEKKHTKLRKVRVRCK